MLSEFFAHCDFIVCLLTDDGHTDDENDDTEYNFMAEDQKEEMEEYRNDRAVRIPRKWIKKLWASVFKLSPYGQH